MSKTLKNLEYIKSIGIDTKQLNHTILTNKKEILDRFTIYRYFTIEDILNINILIQLYDDYNEETIQKAQEFINVYQIHDLLIYNNNKLELTSFSLNMIVDYVIRLGIVFDNNKVFNLEYKSKVKKYMTDILNGYGTPYMCDIVCYQTGFPVCNSENKLNQLGFNIYYSILADYDPNRMEIIKNLYSERPEAFIKFISKMRFYWSESEINSKRIDLGLLVEFEKNNLIETLNVDGTNYFRLNREAQCLINMRGLGNRVNYWDAESSNKGYLFLY